MLILNLLYNIKYKFREILNYSKFKEIKKLKNSKAGKKVFVLGNGNSINKLDFKKIRKFLNNNYELIVMNNFFVSPKSRSLNPNFWLTTDERIANISKNRFPKKQFYNKFKHTKISHKIIRKKKCTILIPHNIKNHNFSNKVIYFNGDINIKSKNYTDVTKARNLFYLTGITAISLALFLGYDKIYICGLDNDVWKTSNTDHTNKIHYNSSYYYEKEEKFSTETYIDAFLDIWNKIFKSYKLLSSKKIINLDSQSLMNYFSKKHSLNIYK